MSEPKLPSLDEAAAAIFDRVHAPAFFNKLAQYGHVPQTQEEALALLELSGKLAAAEQVQAAQSQSGVYKQASAALDGLYGQPQGPSNTEKNAGIALAHDPDIYGAALALKIAEAQQLAQ